eukprot:scaffold15051_cov32-Tisochrysis_lutea.AAC.2
MPARLCLPPSPRPHAPSHATLTPLKGTDHVSPHSFASTLAGRRSPASPPSLSIHPSANPGELRAAPKAVAALWRARIRRHRPFPAGVADAAASIGMCAPHIPFGDRAEVCPACAMRLSSSCIAAITRASRAACENWSTLGADGPNAKAGRCSCCATAPRALPCLGSGCNALHRSGSIFAHGGTAEELRLCTSFSSQMRPARLASAGVVSHATVVLASEKCCGQVVGGALTFTRFTNNGR